MAAGWDGTQNLIVPGLVDLQCISFERFESEIELGGVLAFDRRGNITKPTTGPDSSWEEVYGPDYPWNWQTAGQPNDCPLLDNGVVRVRYDDTNSQPGFSVDMWTGSDYVEQGKMIVYRTGDTAGFDDTWVSAGLVEYTPDRAIILVVLRVLADPWSRERVYITLQRGQPRVRFEVYPSPTSAGVATFSVLEWNLAPTGGVGDANDSAFKSDTQALPTPQGTGVIAATAGTGSSHFPTAVLGATSYSDSENQVAILRCPSAYGEVGPLQHTLTVIQQGAATETANGAGAYGVSVNLIAAGSAAGGYNSAEIAFTPTVAAQAQEAEAIRNSASGTTSQVTDATASGGECVKDTQSALTNPTLTTSTLLLEATYRVFARVKVGAGVTGKFQAFLGANSSYLVTSTSTAWVWIDLGDVTAPAVDPTFAFFAEETAGSAGAYVDRVELFLMDNVIASGCTFNGSRDFGSQALYDSRTLGTLVAR